MGNTAIAKTKLRTLTTRTQKDLYHLRHESKGFTPLTDDVLEMVKDITRHNNMVCPMYKWAGKIQFRDDIKDFYNILNILASEYSIVFNLKEITF